jgi:hypothetical protein
VGSSEFSSDPAAFDREKNQKPEISSPKLPRMRIEDIGSKMKEERARSILDLRSSILFFDFVNPQAIALFPSPGLKAWAREKALTLAGSRG